MPVYYFLIIILKYIVGALQNEIYMMALWFQIHYCSADGQAHARRSCQEVVSDSCSDKSMLADSRPTDEDQNMAKWEHEQSQLCAV